jgi:hypothetical protein
MNQLSQGKEYIEFNGNILLLCMSAPYLYGSTQKESSGFRIRFYPVRAGTPAGAYTETVLPK